MKYGLGRDMTERTWRGEVLLEDDVLVPEGSRLIVEAGCTIRALDRPGSRRLSAQALAFGGYGLLTDARRRHLQVRGELELRGLPERPVVFEGAAWGGILALGRGRVRARRARLLGQGPAACAAADFARLDFSDCELSAGPAALALGGFAAAALRRCVLSGEERALRACDDAQARLLACRLSGSGTGLDARGRARVACAAGEIASRAQTGAVAAGGAIFRARSMRWRGQAIGLSVQERARARLRGGSFGGHEYGIEAIGEAEVRAEGVSLEGNGFGVWVQNRAVLRSQGGDWRANGVGVKLSHGARADLRAARFRSHRKAGLMLEDGARARVAGSRFEADQNGVLVYDGARLEAQSCLFLACREHGVWSAAGGRARVLESSSQENGRDAG